MYNRNLTVLFHLYFCSFIFPKNSRWRRACDITNNVGSVSFCKLLRGGCICEGDFFWNKKMQTHFIHWDEDNNSNQTIFLVCLLERKIFYSVFHKLNGQSIPSYHWKQQALETSQLLGDFQKQCFKSNSISSIHTIKLQHLPAKVPTNFCSHFFYSWQKLSHTDTWNMHVGICEFEGGLQTCCMRGI